MNYKNLNELQGTYTDFENIKPETAKIWRGTTAIRAAAEIDVLFGDLAEQVSNRIREADAVVGCVAWLTSPIVLQALASTRHGVSVILQKEDFLRPDYQDPRTGRAAMEWLKQHYDNLSAVHGPVDGWHEQKGSSGGMAGYINLAIRCIGHMRRSKDEATLPRMHHKFLVFCRYCPDDGNRFWPYEPYAVWTGSFNMTNNGGHSLENAVFIRQADVADAYFQEWARLILVSEQLDWTSEYAAPDIQFNTGAILS
jgi:hypothetical protein